MALEHGLNVKIIESKNNPVVKRALKIIKGQIDDDSLLLVEGHKLIDEARKSGAQPQMVFVEHSENLRDKKALESCCYVVPRALLKELSTVKNATEIVAFFSPPVFASLSASLTTASLLVVLDRIQDPGNLGTILRVSEAMGADAAILLKGSCSPLNPKVIRAAMGSSFRLPVFADVCPDEFFKLARNNSFATICADMDGTPLPQFSFPEKVALILGQEGQGLSKEILKECTCKLAIPMQGQVESLNVATSAAICLYEWSRHRNSPKKI